MFIFVCMAAEENITALQTVLNNEALYKKAILNIKMLCHPLKLQILQIIQQKPRITVTELVGQLALSQSKISQELAALRKAKFIQAYKQGKYVLYSVNEAQLQKLNTIINQYFN
jgi:DNA-binding transcriptional ArsR family regulator